MHLQGLVGFWLSCLLRGLYPLVSKSSQETRGAGILLTMNKTGKFLSIAAGLALLIGYMVYLTMSSSRVSCEVCMEFRGRTDCRRATGANEQEAQTTAITTACGLISGGVGDGIACQNTPPKSVACQAR